MARIRSIHSSIFTGDAFMEATTRPAAALFLIGLWTQADDKGAFEWKPSTLKARILPATGEDGAKLLDFLMSLDLVACYEVDGIKYGAIRKFGLFQRPKKPNDLYPMPEQYRKYACSNDQNTEIENAKLPTGSELSVSKTPPSTEKKMLMEEGGEKEEEEERNPPLIPPSAAGMPRSVEREKKPRPRSRIPDGWAPTPEGVALAAKHGLPLALTVERFVAHHTAKGSLMASWNAAWATWCLSPYNQRPASGAGAGRPGDRAPASQWGEQARQVSELFDGVGHEP